MLGSTKMKATSGWRFEGNFSYVIVKKGILGIRRDERVWRKTVRERGIFFFFTWPDRRWIAIYQSTLTCPSQGQLTFQDGSRSEPPHWLLDLNSPKSLPESSSRCCYLVPIIPRTYVSCLKFRLESSGITLVHYILA